MDNNASTQLSDLLSKHQSVGIAVGKNPGVDEMASALSLYLVLKSQGKNVTVVCPTDALVEHSRLVGIDKVKRDFEATGGDMTVSFPYQEGEIDKISYTLENGLLNIIVKAGEQGLSFNEKDVMFKRSEGYPSLLFVIGTPRLSDLDRIYDPQALKDTTVVNIDNKPDNQGYGDLSIVTPTNSSISEKVADLMLSMGFNIDIDSAQNLLTGIESATGNFQSPKTTSLAFEMTGELIKKGAVRSASTSTQSALPKTDIREEEFDAFDEDLDLAPMPSMPQAPAPFPRQQVRPQQPQPFMPRVNRQPSAGANLQRLQSIQNQIRQSAMQRNQNLPNPPQNLPNQEDRKGKKPPTDWLTPKIYKGSTNI